MPKTWRADSLNVPPEAAHHFERELEAVRKEVVADKVPTRYAFLVFPQDDSLPAYKESYSHRMYEQIGVADWISDYASDLPLVDIAARKETFYLRRFGCAYQHSYDEILLAAGEGLPLDRKRADTARLITEEKHNAAQIFGSQEAGLFGWANYPTVPRIYLADYIGAGTASDDILAQLNDLCTRAFERTGQVASKFVIRMPSRAYGYINSARIPDTQTTILKFLLEQNSMIEEITSMPELTGAGPTGEDVILVYPMDETFGSSKTAELFTQMAPVARNLAVLTNCTAKTGGGALDRPQEMTIAYLPKK